MPISDLTRLVRLRMASGGMFTSLSVGWYVRVKPGIPTSLYLRPELRNLRRTAQYSIGEKSFPTEDDTFFDGTSPSIGRDTTGLGGCFVVSSASSSTFKLLAFFSSSVFSFPLEPLCGEKVL